MFVIIIATVLSTLSLHGSVSEMPELVDVDWFIGLHDQNGDATNWLSAIQSNTTTRTTATTSRGTMMQFSLTKDRVRFNEKTETLINYCEECRVAAPKQSAPCSSTIRMYWSQCLRLGCNGTLDDLRRTMIDIATDPNVEFCQKCHPQSCAISLTTARPLGFDEASPTVLRSRTVSTLQSIPPDRRFPKNFEKYLRERSIDDLAPLAVFNPSIIPIPNKTLESFREVTAHNPSVGGPPVYLASFRVTMVHHHVPFAWGDHPSDYLGLALLDKDFQILREVVVDPNGVLFGAIRMQDWRLFDLNGTLYLTGKARMMPIEVIAVDTKNDSDDGSNATTATTTTKKKKNRQKHSNQPRVLVLPNMFGSGLRMSIFEDSVTGFREVPRGKNLQYYQSLSGEHFVEFWPFQTRVYTMIRNTTTSQVITSGKMDDDDDVQPSFVTDQVLLKGYYGQTRDRGSACCVRLERQYYESLLNDPTMDNRNVNDQRSDRQKLALDQPYLLMGISHTKSKSRIPSTNTFIYLSRLYAFLPQHPFHVVAGSGLFCFGHADKDDFDTPEPYWNLSRQDPLIAYNTTYNCPGLHFVSGITENPTDPSRVVVAYGVQDLLSRFVELHKQDLANHLFHDFGTVLSVERNDRDAAAVMQDNHVGLENATGITSM